LIAKAKCAKDVIGVITQAAGFIANAGQMPASDRIEYDCYHTPITKLNTGSGPGTNMTNIHPELEANQTVQFPATLTVIKPGVDRTIPFVSYDRRENFYQVALLGLVVVRAKFGKHDHHVLKCDVKNGYAVPGSTYFIVQFIGEHHISILLK
jgi:hypothetical protein